MVSEWKCKAGKHIFHEASPSDVWCVACLREENASLRKVVDCLRAWRLAGSVANRKAMDKVLHDFVVEEAQNNLAKEGG